MCHDNQTACEYIRRRYIVDMHNTLHCKLELEYAQSVTMDEYLTHMCVLRIYIAFYNYQ